MAIIKDAEIWFLKADPKRPNKRFNKANPTWEVQLRTTDIAQKKVWESQHLQPKPITDEETGTRLYWKVNLRRKSVKEDGTASTVPEVKDGDLEPVDPNTVGNGSVANIQVFQYEYDLETGGKGIANVFMGLQLIKHVVYKPKPREDEFKQIKTERVEAESTSEEDEMESGDDDNTVVESEAPKTSSVGVPKITGF
jgi:hypothetical protein